MSWKYLVLPNSLRFPRNHCPYAYHELIVKPVEILTFTCVRTCTDNNVRTCITNWSWNRWKYYLVHAFVRAQRIIWPRSPTILIRRCTRSSRRHNILLLFRTKGLRTHYSYSTETHWKEIGNKIVIRTRCRWRKTQKNMDSHPYRNVHDENPYTNKWTVIRTEMFMTKTHTKELTHKNMDSHSYRYVHDENP